MITLASLYIAMASEDTGVLDVMIKTKDRVRNIKGSSTAVYLGVVGSG